jgi:NADPH:quinone reductase
MTDSMKALVVEESGAPFVRKTLEMPVPAAGEVLVRVAASGTNPLDTKIHAGAAAHARMPLPAILGLDMAGTVAALGERVTRFEVGDEVYGMVGGVGGVQGTLAEYASVDADLLARKPANLSMREAAALPLISITAWEGLVDRLGVAQGDTVLVQGGAGGVGHVSIQIAAAFGASVFATGSEFDRTKIEQLGAVFIDREEQVDDYVARLTEGRGFDLVYDTAGGVALDNSFKAVRRFGKVSSCLGWGTHLLAPLSFKSASYAGVFTLVPLLTGEGRAHHGKILEQVRSLAEAGKLTPILDARRFELDGVDQAYAILREGRAEGKIVIEL